MFWQLESFTYNRISVVNLKIKWFGKTPARLICSSCLLIIGTSDVISSDPPFIEWNFLILIISLPDHQWMINPGFLAENVGFFKWLENETIK